MQANLLMQMSQAYMDKYTFTERTQFTWDLLRACSISPGMVGFLYLAEMLMLCTEKPVSGLMRTTALYREVAGRFDVTWQSVERAARMALDKAWNSSGGNMPICTRPGLDEKNRPTITEFLAEASAYLLITHGLRNAVSMKAAE